MQILSHRGCWLDFGGEGNGRAAFERSFEKGFGAEADLRDARGKIVVSHDMPKGGEMALSELLEVMGGRNLPLALNIKADGLADEILRVLREHGHTNYFTFDMSIPDMIFQMDRGLSVFTGESDVMRTPVLLERAAGVWLDSFYSEWFGEGDVREILEKGKKVCVVSAELHGRDPAEQWEKIRRLAFSGGKSLMLCTDRPERARAFFGGGGL